MFTILHDLATPYIHALHVGSKVTSLTADSITLANGTTLGDFDVIIGADGLHSIVRASIVPDNSLQRTGEAAYRATVPMAKLNEDAELKELVAGNVCTTWIGPGRHVTGYPMVRRFLCFPF